MASALVIVVCVACLVEAWCTQTPEDVLMLVCEMSFIALCSDLPQHFAACSWLAGREVWVIGIYDGAVYSRTRPSRVAGVPEG